jgi:cytoskeletal protein CcmA (bactofilin family)
MAERASAETIIGTGARIVGDVSFDGPARILGTIEGTIVTKSDLQIGAGASCKANIEAQRLAVDGAITGNVTARESLELAANAKIEGDLITAKLVVTEGATFVGYCRVGPEASKAMANGQTTARPSRPASASEVKPASKPEPVKA